MQARIVTGPLYLSKRILYAKLTYCNHPNKNVEHPKNYKDLGSTKIRVMLHSQNFDNNFTTNPMG